MKRVLLKLSGEALAQQLELKQNPLYILLVFPDLYVLAFVQCNERKAVALAH